MTLDFQACSFAGPAFPAPFVRYELAALLLQRGLLAGAAEAATARAWERMRRALRALGQAGGPLRVHNHVIAALAPCLGYAPPQRQQDVATREGQEDGGWLMQTASGARLRAWSVAIGTDLDAPRRSGHAYRYSPERSARRVLQARAEPVGLLTNGEELRLLLSDPTRAASHIAIPLSGSLGWQEHARAPDSWHLLRALASPDGLAALAGVLDAARLSQVRVTQELRVQARGAVEGFLQGVLDHQANRAVLHREDDRCIAGTLWAEGLVVVYRLLFILKLETAADPARAFSFAASRLWREALSPNQALGPLVRRHLDHGHDTGGMLEHGLRTIFRMFRDGLSCSELAVASLGGALFGAAATPLLDRLAWGERGTAVLLDRLLWTAPRHRERERVHYGSLDVEDLGRVYEALLELEPGIAAAPMVRLRRANLEVVVPADRATPSRAATVTALDDDTDTAMSRVTWRQDIPPGCFYLRVGSRRKATGSYYTPHEFVRFLVREALGPTLQRCSPSDDPRPAAILALRVVDPAAGSGHFLVETCRFLGEALYLACRTCDQQAAAAEAAADHADATDRLRLLQRAAELRGRVTDLPDPDRLLQAYLPSRASERGDSGISQNRATAICRRLVAVHCLYGVDRNPLAVELAKLSLWLESYAEGLPLTFLDHRLVHGDSIVGPFFAQLARLPVGGSALDPLLAGGVLQRLGAALQNAQGELRALEASIGTDAADLASKEFAKARLDASLNPLRQLARAWCGAAMLSGQGGDDEFLNLARIVAESGAFPANLTRPQAAMLDAGALALPWDLVFPEVFRVDAAGVRCSGFDVVLSNPPWDIIQQNAKEFLAGYDLSILDAPTKREARVTQQRLLADPALAREFRAYQEAIEHQHRMVARLYAHQKQDLRGGAMGGKLDAFRVFAERQVQLCAADGVIGAVVPSSFHANEGATGIRSLYLNHTNLECCLSFENQQKLFDVHGRMKFALIIARLPGPTRSVRVGFYLENLRQLDDPTRIMLYDTALIGAAGGDHLSFLELRSADDLAIARRIFLVQPSLRDWIAARGIVLGREMNITDDADRVTPIFRLLHHGESPCDPAVMTALLRRGYLTMHEGKTIHQFRDDWSDGPRYAVASTALQDKPAWQDNARCYRLALRRIARSTDERTAIAAFTAPAHVFDITLQCEKAPQRRPHAVALQLCAVLNSHVFDWSLRQKTAVTVNLFILETCPVCDLSEPAARFLAHAALRLSCNHAGYAPLWREQLGTAWREAVPPQSWPVIREAAARWELRALVDAVVAHSYGLERPEYQRILDSFTHRSCPASPALCVAAFDALAGHGLAAFCRQHDPYHDIPLITSLPRAALPAAATRKSAAAAALFATPRHVGVR